MYKCRTKKKILEKFFTRAKKKNKTDTVKRYEMIVNEKENMQYAWM